MKIAGGGDRGIDMMVYSRGVKRGESRMDAILPGSGVRRRKRKVGSVRMIRNWALTSGGEGEEKA